MTTIFYATTSHL